MIKEVKIHESKKKDVWKFEIIAHKIKSKNKIYLWKCYSKEQRNKWVFGLKEHCNSLNHVITEIECL